MNASLRGLLGIGIAFVSSVSVAAADGGADARYAQLLAKPQLTRTEKAALVDPALNTYIANLSAQEARTVATSGADASSRALVAWVRSEANQLPVEERLFYFGQLFNKAKTTDPMSATLHFSHAAALYPADYVQVTLFEAMVAAGWSIDAQEFDICMRKHLAMRLDQR